MFRFMGVLRTFLVSSLLLSLSSSPSPPPSSSTFSSLSSSSAPPLSSPSSLPYCFVSSFSSSTGYNHTG